MQISLPLRRKSKGLTMPKVIHIPNVSLDERIGSVFNSLFRIINATEEAEEDTVEWDFSNASFFHPFFLAPMAIYKHRSGKKIICKNHLSSMRDYFTTIAFERSMRMDSTDGCSPKVWAVTSSCSRAVRSTDCQETGTRLWNFPKPYDGTAR